MRALLSVSAVALALTGCTVERSYAPSEREDFTRDDEGLQENWDNGGWEEEPTYSGNEGTLPITSGRVRGDIGPVRDFDAETDYVDSYGDAYWTNITLNATDANGRVGMIILDISNMDLQNAPAGTYVYSAQNVTGDGEIYVTGCSSTSTGDAMYDAPAEEGTVVIQDNPDGTRDVEIEATLPGETGGNSQAQATFTIE